MKDINNSALSWLKFYAENKHIYLKANDEVFYTHSRVPLVEAGLATYDVNGRLNSFGEKVCYWNESGVTLVKLMKI